MLRSALLLAPLCPSPQWGNYFCHEYVFPLMYPAQRLPPCSAAPRRAGVPGLSPGGRAVRGQCCSCFIAPRAALRQRTGCGGSGGSGGSALRHSGYLCSARYSERANPHRSCPESPVLLTWSAFSPWICILNEIYSEPTPLQRVLSAQ